MTPATITNYYNALHRKGYNWFQFLTKNGLVLTTVSEISSETLAKSLAIVAKTTSRTVSTFFTSISSHHVGTRRAFFSGTVGSAVPDIAFATNLFLGIPRFGVSGSSFGCKCFLSQANASAGAIIRTNSSLACHTIIIIEAIAFTTFAITETFPRTFYWRVSIIFGNRRSSPCCSVWTCPQRTIMASPLWQAIRTNMASAFIWSKF